MLLDSFRQEFVSLLADALGTDDIALSDIASPPQPEMGDFAFPCFRFAQQLKKSPQDIAAAAAQTLMQGRHRQVERTEAVGGFVNIAFAPGYVAQRVFEAFHEQGSAYGTSNVCTAKKVMIEFSQPNTHKEFHIGHVRNVAIGDSLVRLHRHEGCWTLAVNYIGDFGMDVAKCLWGIQKNHPNERPPKGKEVRWLGQVYAEAAQQLKENESLKSEVNTVLNQLDTKDSQIMPLYLETKEWCMKYFHAIYDELDVRFDDWFFESDVKDEGREFARELLERGVAKESQGALIVDLQEYGLDVLLILKSDGNALYSTYDLALAQEKFRRYEVDEAVYVTDVRQSFYFKQLFKTLELAGFDKQLVHVGYEFVRLPEGAMASREGRIVRYEDVRNSVLELARNETAVRHADWSSLQVDRVAKAVGFGALKFDMLKQDTNKIIVFDAAQAVSFVGYTAPYLQYTYARIQSIMRKAQQPSGEVLWFDHADASLLTQAHEKRLLFALAAFGSTVSQAREQSNPALLCRYVYDTARLFSEFYEKSTVLCDDETLRLTRLQLCSYVAHVIEQGLSLLGIGVVDEM